MYNLKVSLRFLVIVFFVCSIQASMASGYFPFIAENSGTKIARGTLNTVLGGGKASRAGSHRVYIISAFSRDMGLGEHNRSATKKGERIYEAASWDQGDDIKILVTPSRKTAKKLLDFNPITADGQILCQPKSVQRLRLTSENVRYINLIHSSYGLADLQGNEEAILKSYDPACILDDRIRDMEVSLSAKKKKLINVHLNTTNAGPLRHDVVGSNENLVVVD